MVSKVHILQAVRLSQPDEELKKMLFACVDRIDEIKSIV